MCSCNKNTIDYINQELEKSKNSLNNAYAAEGGLSTKANSQSFFRGKIEALASLKNMLGVKSKSKNKNKKHLKSSDS